MENAERQKRQGRALEDALHWIWSCQIQQQRLTESTKREFEGADRTMMEMRRVYSQTTLDEYLALVVGRNLVRALDVVREEYPHISIGQEMEQLIKLMRDVYEHWDENMPVYNPAGHHDNRGNKQLRKAMPEAKPWSMSYTPDGPALGGVLYLRDLAGRLRFLEQQLLELRGLAGRL